jgi:hypothetical protein
MQIATLYCPMSEPNVSRRTFMNLDIPHNRNGVSQAGGSIRARFFELGYVEEDIQRLHGHHEVSNTKPMSDRGAPARDSHPCYLT